MIGYDIEPRDIIPLLVETPVLPIAVPGGLVSRVDTAATRAMGSLPEVFRDLGFLDILVNYPVAEQLYWIKELSSESQELSALLFAHLEKFNIKDLPQEDRLAFCNDLGKLGWPVTRSLAMNFMELGFFEDLLKCKNVETRLALCETFVDQGEWGAWGIAKNLNRLDLNGAEIAVRLRLSKKIISYGGEPAQEWIRHSSLLRSTLLSQQEIFSLCEMIGNQGGLATLALVRQIHLFRIETISLVARFALTKKIISQGRAIARVVANNFGDFVIKDLDLESRYSLSLLIASKGGAAAEAILDNIEQFKLDEGSFYDRLTLCKTIAAQSDRAAKKMADKLNLLKWDDFEKRQILMELLVPPSQLVDTSCKHFGFVSELNPVIEALLQDKNEWFERFIEDHPILPLYKTIKTIGDKKARIQLTQWMAYCVGVFHDMTDDHRKIIYESGLLTDLLQHRNPQNRLIISRLLSLIDVEAIKQTPTEAKARKWSGLAWILLSRLIQIGFSQEGIKKILGHINQVRGFRDTKQFNTLVQLLLLVIEHVPYMVEEIQMIEEVITRIVARKAVKKQRKGEGQQKRVIDLVSSDFQVLINIIKLFGKETFLNGLASEKEDLQSLFQDKFQERFEIVKEEEFDFAERYQETFGRFRDEMALFTYLGTVERIKGPDRVPVKKALTTYVSSVFNKTFPGIRYDEKHSQHLKFIFEKKSDLKALWLQKAAPKVVGRKYIISESDDACDLLMSGTEINGSCQRVDGVALGASLVGYLLNGEIRAIVIKDKEGKIVARGMICLMWDKTNQTPVIFQERLYSNVKDEALNKALTLWAVEKANRMGLSLVTKEVGGGKVYPGILECLAGFSPLVYSDALEGIQKGAFEVKQCHILSS